MKKRHWKKLFPETVIQHLRIDSFRLSFISKNKRLKLTGCKKENSKLIISFELIAVRIDSRIGSIRIDSIRIDSRIDCSQCMRLPAGLKIHRNI